MTGRSTERSPLIQSRVAGLLALVTLVAGSFAGFVHTRLIVPGDPETTANNIIASETLFRLGFVASLTMYTVFIFYVLALYKLLRQVNKDQALLMLVLALVGVPIAMLNQINQSAALLLRTADYSKVFAADQINAQVTFFLDMYKQGALIGVIFWGLWLFPLGLLVYKSRYVPRILGVLLMIGCFGWLTVFIQRFLFPRYGALAYARFAAHVAELSWMLWLLIKGIDATRLKKHAFEK